MYKLGHRIKQLRETNNLTQQQLGKMLGVDQGAISRWEKGRIQPSARYRKKIEKVLTGPLDSAKFRGFLFSSVQQDVNSSALLDLQLNILAVSEPMLDLINLDKKDVLDSNYLALLRQDWQQIYQWLEEKGAFSKELQWLKVTQPTSLDAEADSWLQSVWTPFILENNELIFRVSTRQLKNPQEKLVNIHLQLTENNYELALLI